MKVDEDTAAPWLTRTEASAFAARSRRALTRTTGVIIPLILLWIALSLAAPRFLTWVNLSNLSVQFAIIGTLAIGTTAIIICREIDLSIGAIEGACAVIGAMILVNFGLPWPLAVIGAIASGGLIGLGDGSVWAENR